MRHGVMHQGGFADNAQAMTAGRHTYRDQHGEHPLPDWPPDIDGIRFGALERGARLLIARVTFADQDVILHHPVPLDITRHLGGQQRPGPAVTRIADHMAEAVLDDVLASNAAQSTAIALVVNRVNQVRRAAREQAATRASEGERDER